MQGILIKCPCGHQFRYKGKLLRATCANCGGKVWVPERLKAYAKTRELTV